MNVKVLIFSILLPINLFAQSTNEEQPIELKTSHGFTIGFDVSFSPEQFTNKFPSYHSIKKPLHISYKPSMAYNFAKKHGIGAFVGIGNAKSETYNSSRMQNERLRSTSYECGLFYKYQLFENASKKFKVYLMPQFRTSLTQHLLDMEEDYNKQPIRLSGIQHVFTKNINLKVLATYTIFNHINIGAFLSNDLATFYSTDIEPDRITENGQSFIARFVYFGVSASYSFGY